MNATLTLADDRPLFERLWARLVSLVATPGDDDEALRKKRLLLVVVLAKAPVCPSLAVAYYTLGVPLAALVPIVYQLLTILSVVVFLLTRKFDRFRFQQTLIIFLGPIALHYFLGGFVNSSGVILSAFLAPLIAILFHGGRQSWPWFVALWIVLMVLAAFDSTLAAQAHIIPDSARVVFFLFHIGAVGTVTYAAIRYHASLLDTEKAEQVSLNERLRLTASELSLALSRLEDTNVALAEAGRQKSRFLAGISHELRTPLNAIIGYSEMLEEEAAELGKPSFTQDLQKIHVSGQHLLGLIDDVLDLSKIEAGRMQVFAERIEIAALISGVVAVAEPLTKKNNNRLVVESNGATRSTQHRRHQGPAGDSEPALQFGEVHRTGNHHARGRGQSRWHVAGVLGARHGHRHDAGAAGTSVRGVFAGGGRHLPALRRHGPGTRAQPPARPHPGWRYLGRQHVRRRVDVHVHRAARGAQSRKRDRVTDRQWLCESQREDPGGFLPILRYAPPSRPASDLSRDSAVPEGRVVPRDRQPETPAGAFAVPACARERAYSRRHDHRRGVIGQHGNLRGLLRAPARALFRGGHARHDLRVTRSRSSRPRAAAAIS